MPLVWVDWLLCSQTAYFFFRRNHGFVRHVGLLHKSLGVEFSLIDARCALLRLKIRQGGVPQAESILSLVGGIDRHGWRAGDTALHHDLVSVAARHAGGLQAWRCSIWSDFFQLGFQSRTAGYGTFGLADLRSPVSQADLSVLKGRSHTSNFLLLDSGAVSFGEIFFQQRGCSFSRLTLRWFRLQFFILLLNTGWHVLAPQARGALSAYNPLLSSCTSASGAHSYSRIFSINVIWVRWNHIFYLFFNLFYYHIPVCGFGQLGHKYLIDVLNWASWSWSVYVWKYTHLFFYFKHCQQTRASIFFFTRLKSQVGGTFLFLNVSYHYQTLKIFGSLNMLSIGLCDPTVEPWLCWYPVFCRGSDRLLQHLFLVFVLKLKVFCGNLSAAQFNSAVMCYCAVWFLSSLRSRSVAIL